MAASLFVSFNRTQNRAAHEKEVVPQPRAAGKRSHAHPVQKGRRFDSFDDVHNLYCRILGI